MMNSRSKILIAAMILFLSVLACAVPTLPVSQPTPTFDAVALETMVAEKVSAALQETANASTVAPPATVTARPPAETSTPEVIPLGSTLTKQEDGSILFVDDRAGYEVTVPAGWLAVRIDGREYLDAFTLAEAVDPAVQRSLLAVQNQDPNKFRLFAFDTQDGHIQSNFVTNINFLWDQQNGMSLADDTDLKEIAASLPSVIPGIKILTTEIIATAGGISIGSISSEWITQTTDNPSVPVYQKQVFLKAGTGTLAITFTTTGGLKDTILPAFDAMIETIEAAGR